MRRASDRAEQPSRTWEESAALVPIGRPQELSLTFLKTVTTMLEAVVFFLVGVGLYSLFIAPLNLAGTLGVDTLNDREERVTSVVVAILAVTFLEHFIQWERPRAQHDVATDEHPR